MITAIRRRVKSARQGNDGGKIDVMIFNGLPTNGTYYQDIDPGRVKFTKI